MTTPSDPVGDGQNDPAPYLPPSRPTATGSSDTAIAPSPTDGPGDQPYVPAPVPVAPPPVVEPVFDAKAMVESQKHYQANPAYGALPTSTEASKDAALKLRAKAQKKRQRNKRLGWFVAVLMLGGVGAAGWFAYQAYQDEQDQQALDAAAAERDGPEPGALSPVGELVEANEALDDLNSVTPGIAGGLLGAVEDARTAVDALNDPEADGDDAGVVVAEPTPELAAARSLTFMYRRWESADASSPMVEYTYAYDVVDDRYVGDIRRDDPPQTLTGVDAKWRYTVAPDGSVERVPRSPASHEPSPDVRLARVVRPGDVVPESAQPFATIVSEGTSTASGDVVGYSIDTDAWRNADPGGFLAWVQTWHEPGAERDELGLPGRREVGAVPVDPNSLPTVVRQPFVEFTAERAEPGASVTYVVSPNDQVLAAWVIDNAADFRAMYAFVGSSDEPSSLTLGDQAWSPAP